MAEQANFPRFEDGDVLILAPGGQTWKLHSGFLNMNSPHFRDLIGNAPEFHLTKKQKLDGQTIKHKFRMIVDSINRDFVTFRAVDPKEKGSFNMPVNANGLGLTHPYLQNYDNFFKCIYNIDPTFDTTSADKTVRDCEILLRVSETMNSTPVVRRFIESALLRLGQTLYSSIHQSVEFWADLGIRLQSPTIFREAMCHIIGASYVPNLINRAKLQSVPNSSTIIGFCNRKLNMLILEKQQIDRALMTYFPADMMHKSSQGRRPSRVIYANDIYLWQSLVLVRQYVTEAMMTRKTWQAPDGGFTFYRKIYMGKDQYLTRQDLQPFFRDFEMSTKGRECFEVALFWVKEQMRRFVESLFTCHAQDMQGVRVENWQYFLCADVKDEELPWVVAAKMKLIAAEAVSVAAATQPQARVGDVVEGEDGEVVGDGHEEIAAEEDAAPEKELSNFSDIEEDA